MKLFQIEFVNIILLMSALLEFYVPGTLVVGLAFHIIVSLGHTITLFFVHREVAQKLSSGYSFLSELFEFLISPVPRPTQLATNALLEHNKKCYVMTCRAHSAQLWSLQVIIFSALLFSVLG